MVIMIGLRQVYSEKEQVGGKRNTKCAVRRKETLVTVILQPSAGRDTGIVKEINMLGRGLLCTGPREGCSQVKTLPS